MTHEGGMGAHPVNHSQFSPFWPSAVSKVEEVDQGFPLLVGDTGKPWPLLWPSWGQGHSHTSPDTLPKTLGVGR